MLDLTLEAIGRLRLARDEAEVVVVDNASKVAVEAPTKLANGLRVKLLRLPANLGAAARNHAAEAAGGRWLVMLDDDSFPLDAAFAALLEEAPTEVAAINAEIVLGSGAREAGGLPEVFIGCGVAVRREAFLAAGGYDAAFGYYAEEYDLAARFIGAGYRIVHDRRFRVMHEKVSSGRDMNVILRRLVRNNGWVVQRYTPHDRREAELAHTIERYRQIAVKEAATEGYERGLAELRETLGAQPDRALSPAHDERFTGLAVVRETLANHPELRRSRRIALVAEGKNANVIRAAIDDSQHALVADSQAEVVMVGTLSPGPMLDALEAAGVMGNRRVIAPWLPVANAVCSSPRAKR